MQHTRVQDNICNDQLQLGSHALEKMATAITVSHIAKKPPTPTISRRINHLYQGGERLQAKRVARPPGGIRALLRNKRFQLRSHLEGS